ncbi:MAG: ATP-binding cassette domain-containing protein [Clostridium sp.]
MLQLKNIIKTYETGGFKQSALDGVSLNFRNNEFVAILGASGSGKTTMLNVIGGLDRYDSGDLIINGVSTKEYKEKDWDTYRNHSVGFVFQSYNLIPHQTVLSNVELALTLSGVSKKERKERAIEMLKKVGLGDHIHKKPNQMSGGQMQRVAIARALVNDPEILLADEPTGALDSETSVQIMELLKEIANDKLVIMVTHNPELAEEYANRIVKLKDGKIIGDTRECTDGEDERREGDNKKTSMSFKTALALSFNNLLTKKGRTLLTAFAGSIGIIGIAMILSLSTGVNNYIAKVQEDTLSTFPIMVEEKAMDLSSMMGTMSGVGQEFDKNTGSDGVYEMSIMNDVLNAMGSQVKSNNLIEFKKFLEGDESKIKDYANDIQYTYDLDLQVYSQKGNEVLRVNPSEALEKTNVNNNSDFGPMAPSFSNVKVWTELMNNRKLLESQYDVLAGKWPTEFNEVVFVVDENNQVTDAALYALGLKDPKEIDELMKAINEGEKVDATKNPTKYSFDDILALNFKLILNSDYYDKNPQNIWINKKEDEKYMEGLLNNALDIKVVGVIKPNSEAVSSAIQGTIGYSSELSEYVINKVNESEIVKEQKGNKDIDIFTGKPFPKEDELNNKVDISSLPPQQQAMLAGMSENSIKELLSVMSGVRNSTYEQNLKDLGVVDLNYPSGINIYPKDFEAKSEIGDIIKAYNEKMKNDGKEENVISYNDMVEVLMSSVKTIVDMVSYVLIAFVSISLIVSSIMIGIITYISVLERTKEIGILRSIGASKKDISRVFNAETFIVGFGAGAVGIIITLILLIPINAIVKSIVAVSQIAFLNPTHGVILIVISMILTVIAGLIPSKMAAKKDPVEALRME